MVDNTENPGSAESSGSSESLGSLENSGSLESSGSAESSGSSESLARIEYNPKHNQPKTWQWALVGGIGLMVLCGFLLFATGLFFTATGILKQNRAQTTAPAVEATTAAPAQDETLIRAADWPLVLADSFDDDQNGWVVDDVDDDYASLQITIDGTYRWEGRAKQSMIWRVWPEIESTTDFYLALDAHNQGGNQDTGYGPIMRNDGDDYFYWQVYDSGYFRFYSYNNEVWNELISANYTAAIRAGEENHLEVVSEDGVFKFWINGQFVGQSLGSIPESGLAGVAVDLHNAGDECLVVFDNFELRAPGPKK